MNCPHCNSPMVALRSMSKRQCSNGKCSHEVCWTLDEGQKPLIGSSRQDRRATPR